MIKSNNYFPRIIKEICNELDINYEFLSKDWIIKLSKDEKIRFISGYKFDLLNHASGICFDDKYATYEVLNSIGVSTVKHDIIYRATNKNSYANDCKGLEYLIELFNKYKRNIVLKVNNGTCGIDVYHITNINDLKDKYNLLISKNYSLSICPFYEIENEYRAIILNGEVKLLYKKIKPVVTGDSIKTIKELLMDFNNEYFKNYDDDNKDDETCNEIFVLAKKIMNILKDVYNAESVYLCTMCDGPMNHFHIQLIPRYSFEKRGSKNFVKPRFEYKEDKEKLLELRKQLNYKVGE